MPARIEDYALLGDCETAALVSRNGSIDWLCWPRFDSGACCAALLGGPEHGCWALAPADPEVTIKRRYRPDTLILETDFTTAHGAVTLIDFMPVRDGGSHVIRIVRGRRGRVRMRSQLILRFDYGQLIPWVTRLDDGRLSFIAGPHRLVLSTTVALRGEDLTTVAEFGVAAGESVSFVLSYTNACETVPRSAGPVAALRATERFWRQWVGQSSEAGEYGEAVRRSLITLKALTYRPSGGILAAATTSLPERLGGERNWDYRYCWLRDATFTLQAMMNTAHYAEAEAWRSWLLRAAAGDADKLQILYSVSGERLQPEWQLPWLPGYEGSAPVRIGNAASQQLQLDVFGELMEVLHQARCSKLAGKEAGWSLQLALLSHLERVWRQPDRGIWEIRGAPRHFTHSKVMAWVAMDRAIRSAEQFRLAAPLRRWRSLRRRMHRDICRHGFNRRIGAFVRSYGAHDVDASTLLLPLVGFLPAADPRVRGTVAAIERRLLRDGLVRRYESRAGDGLRGGEGAFVACSFWLADNYVLLGRRADARRLFERLLALRNDVGLLSEEYDTGAQRFLGNFPQSLSHIALINTALNLMRRTGPAQQRAEDRGHARSPDIP
ncbi:MAG TPA: glycoside hydrolase family 15 protein [Steroidobacteraceae bacterium]|nr:glycoside hydrolase family 15 protein [Steroidobacteraceae bacterium]